MELHEYTALDAVGLRDLIRAGDQGQRAGGQEIIDYIEGAAGRSYSASVD